MKRSITVGVPLAAAAAPSVAHGQTLTVRNHQLVWLQAITAA